ncbi:SpoIIE family protein phosphatase [Vicingus serpentipes]|uniref:SpoIIE family protein phosphatase n=1 Tax=Vicingus serpentipes TaxID=1926625 RepID=A0A5C6RXW6_9FLAO|nr:SpoIIE family protein phosphatase [Vicingus serpentipes]TXB66855.1 SpoIIE family protein phosphatase [Vicingus serpentipes]
MARFILTLISLILLQQVFSEVNIDSLLIEIEKHNDNSKALDSYVSIEIEQDYDIGFKIKSDSLRAKYYDKLSSHYFSKGNAPKCISYSFLALYLYEKNKDQIGISNCYYNLSDMYAIINDFEKSKIFFSKYIDLIRQNNMGDDYLVGYYGNIGLDYFMPQGMYDTAIVYLKKGIELNSHLDYGNQILFHSSIARCYSFLGQIDSSDFHYKILHNYYKTDSLNLIREKAYYLVSAGQTYFEQNKIIKAESSLKGGVLIADSIKLIEPLLKGTQQLYQLYKAQNKKNKALFYLEKYHKAYSSLYNTSQQQKSVASLLNYQAEKKQIEMVAKQELIEFKATEEISHQKFIRNIIIISTLILLILLVIIFQKLHISRKQNIIIENQKITLNNSYNELDRKNKETIDSIAYAKRIQTAILPPNKLISKHLQNSFILYKPKDIVAGDFYWLEPTKNAILLAAADCTGHGVPGAMVSVVCNNGLNRAVREHGLTDPGQILDKTREIVIQEFEKSEDEVKDGMDIALCSIADNKLQYAGAHNPLWIIRKGEIIETKANKQPIGKFDNPEPYTTHSFDLQKGDSIYIFSDGYVDQFGGEKGKKFKVKAFRELLLSIQDKLMEDQKQIIDEAFETWKGDLEQIDDVCVIGVRV